MIYFYRFTGQNARLLNSDKTFRTNSYQDKSLKLPSKRCIKVQFFPVNRKTQGYVPTVQAMY